MSEHCCCYGFLSTPKPLPSNHREVIHGDALKWLYGLGPKGFPEKACVVTSLPDWSELKKGQNMSLKEYLEWFKKAPWLPEFGNDTIKKTTKRREGQKGLRSNEKVVPKPFFGVHSVSFRVNDNFPMARGSLVVWIL